MHIILDVYGGINRSTIGEAAGHWGWFHNQTHFEYSMQVIDAIISFIQNSGHPESYTLEPLSQPPITAICRFLEPVLLFLIRAPRGS